MMTCVVYKYGPFPYFGVIDTSWTQQPCISSNECRYHYFWRQIKKLSLVFFVGQKMAFFFPQTSPAIVTQALF